ncbi:unnamed protein product [Sympodiomycopsis kandeliae]
MDYYAKYGPLLQVPAPNAFSTGDGSRRAIIPDFTSAAQPAEAFRDWAEKICYPDFPSSTWWQFRASAICISGIILICSLIIGRRLYERSFWIFRLVRRGKGLLVVPNAMMAFTVFTGLFGIVLVAMNFVLVRMFEHKSQPPYNLVAWLTLPWLSIKSGGVYAAWGSHHARPTTLSSDLGRGSSKCRLRSFFTHPMTLNVLCFGPPVVLDIAILIPSLIINSRWNTNIHKYLDWNHQWHSTNTLNREMLVGFQSIWYESINIAHGMAVIFAVWAVQAAFIAFCYTVVGMRLLLTIRKQIRTLESRDSDMHLQTVSSPKLDDDKVVSPRMAQRPQDVDLGSSVQGNGEKSRDASALQLPNDPEGQTRSFFTPQQMDEDRPVPTFFPPVRPSKVVGRKMMSRNPAKSTQAIYLRHVGANFLVQYLAIALAVVMFCGIAMFGSIIVVPIMETNRLGAGLSRALLWASWNSTFFGVIVMSAIAGRVMEFLPMDAIVPATAEKVKAARLPLRKQAAGILRNHPPASVSMIGQIQIHTTRTETALTPASSPASHLVALSPTSRPTYDDRVSTSTRASSINEPLNHEKGPYLPSTRYFSRYHYSRRSSEATCVSRDQEADAAGKVFVDSLPLSRCESHDSS